MTRMVSLFGYVSWCYTDDFVASSHEGDRILRDCGVGLRDFARNVRNSRMGCKVVVTDEFKQELIPYRRQYNCLTSECGLKSIVGK